jgi:large conductance mechanosensitive channel
MLKEFKEFALKGSMIDLAVGVIVGVATGTVITSLVSDIIMPPIGMILGKVDFTNLFVTIWGQHFATLQDAKATGAVTINYGLFINNVINFLIIMFVIFLLIKQVSRMRKEPAPTVIPCPYCKMSIDVNAVRCPHCTSELKTA